SCSYCLRRTFFFSWSRAPRDLPSFPTRRSSDLVRPRVERRFQPRSRGREIEDDLMVSEEVGVVFGRRRCAGDERPRGRGPAFARSEEHTSELQSRENLVCRLLLEKKKKKKRIDR